MEILYFLEKIRVPVLNELMLLVTRFGASISIQAIMCYLSALLVRWQISS